MPLPIQALATASVTIAGTEVEYRALSREEALRLNAYVGREDEAEVLVLTCATGCTEDDARAFRAGNDVHTAGLLIDGILILSGLAQRTDDGTVVSRLTRVETGLEDVDPNS